MEKKNQIKEIVPVKIWYVPIKKMGTGVKLFLLSVMFIGCSTFMLNNVEDDKTALNNNYEEIVEANIASEYIPESLKPKRVTKSSAKIIEKKKALEVVKENTEFPATKNGIEVLSLKKNKTEWDQFRLRVYEIAGDIKSEFPHIMANQIQIYDWSMKLMFHESRYDINAHNSIDAQGLFQAIPSTRKWLKCGKLKGRTWQYQLSAYHKYIVGCLKGVDVRKINDFGDWYYLGLFPTQADKPDDTVFGDKRGNSRSRANYKCNKGLDANKDGKIIKGEVKNLIVQRIEKAKTKVVKILGVKKRV